MTHKKCPIVFQGMCPSLRLHWFKIVRTVAAYKSLRSVLFWKYNYEPLLKWIEIWIEISDVDSTSMNKQTSIAKSVLQQGVICNGRHQCDIFVEAYELFFQGGRRFGFPSLYLRWKRCPNLVPLYQLSFWCGRHWWLHSGLGIYTIL